MSVSGALGHFGGSLGSEFQKPCLLPPGFLNVSLGGEGVLREQFGGKFQKPCLLPPGFLNVSLGGAGALWGQFGGEFQKPCLLPPGFLNVSLGGAGALWGQFGGEFTLKLLSKYPCPLETDIQESGGVIERVFGIY